MEFKGSKGPWFRNGDVVESEEVFICDCFAISDEDTYNAQLISKTPEILEMLQECYKYLPYEGVMRKKVEKLIKQATEL